jgi:hypothetical protein
MDTGAGRCGWQLEGVEGVGALTAQEDVLGAKILHKNTKGVKFH